ncbi:MAG TPA: cytochrome c biogenesis protein ResB [Spirochaetales bacterium]|nr:cytochrome c biogenesis protein ResB [Spirochaetales bacterium]HPS14801.1 cytochrome c biogenesis protein ResB [Spirochaetales bacterium]
MKSYLDRFYDTLRSVKLAIVLLAILVLLAIVGGVVPQGKPVDFYPAQFGGSIGKLIVLLGFNRVFSSIVFLITTALFAVNLTVCTFHRLTQELGKSWKKRRHGPDILHVGILILLFGAVLTARTRTENIIELQEGQSSALPDGSTLTLTAFNFETYPDGRPKTWVSTVTVGTHTQTQRQIKVNAPLREHGYSIYQKYWKNESEVVLLDPTGMEITLQQGMRQPTTGGFVFFMAINTDENPSQTQSPASLLAGANQNNPVFLVEDRGKRLVVKANEGDKVGPFIYKGTIEKSISGLSVVSDKGYPYVVAGFVLVAIGVFLTYVQKLKGLVI